MKFRLKGKYNTNQVWLNGSQLLPEKSQRVYNHSPDGFSWGYAGSGPSQLALAITLELTGRSDNYQDLKRMCIETLPFGDFDQDLDFDFS